MKHSRAVERKVTSATNLDIERILQYDNVSYDEKIKMYLTASTRYLSATKNSILPWFAPVLGKLFKLSDNVIIFQMKNKRLPKNIIFQNTGFFGTYIKNIKQKRRN